MNRRSVALSPAKEWRDPIFAAPSPSRKDTGPLTTPRHRETPLSPFRSPLMGSAIPAMPAGSPLGSHSRRALASPVRDVRQAERGDHGGGGGNIKRLAQLCILRTAQAQLDSANPRRPLSSAQPSPIFSAESPGSLLCQAGSALSSSAQARASSETVQAPCSAPSGPMSAREGAADMFDPFLLPAPAFPLRDQPSSPPPLPVPQTAQVPSAEDTGASSADGEDRCGLAGPPQRGDATAAAMAETAEKNVTMARDERREGFSAGQEAKGDERIRMGIENVAQTGATRADSTRAGTVRAEPTRADCENRGRIGSRGSAGGKRGDHGWSGGSSREAQSASVRSTLMELAANKKLPHGPRKGDPMYECKRCPLASPARSPLSGSAALTPALTPPVHLPSRLHIPAALTGVTRGANVGVGMGRVGLMAPSSCGSSPRGESSSLWGQQQQYQQQQQPWRHQQQQPQQQPRQQNHPKESQYEEEFHISGVSHLTLLSSHASSAATCPSGSITLLQAQLASASARRLGRRNSGSTTGVAAGMVNMGGMGGTGGIGGVSGMGVHVTSKGVNRAPSPNRSARRAILFGGGN
ncbi:hypothetical protein CLOM_g12656 [Closterium sp. NIES-68]|nr:hypothetical protein CLOM_g12656 [Closterium sp. NIES-68]GJP82752.1 hypothetical protein CLOP_g12994 [Closterium sp. NIES-67]